MVQDRILLRNFALCVSIVPYLKWEIWFYKTGQSLEFVSLCVSACGERCGQCVVHAKLRVLMTGVPESGFKPGSHQGTSLRSMGPTRAGWNRATFPAYHLHEAVVLSQRVSWLWGKKCARLELALGSQGPQLLGTWLSTETPDPLSSALYSDVSHTLPGAQQDWPQAGVGRWRWGESFPAGPKRLGLGKGSSCPPGDFLFY